jgi:hypothetical protein
MTLAVLVIPPPITVIVPVWFPIAMLAVFILTVMVPLFEPDVALSDNQETSSLAVQDPFEVTVRDWFAGFAAP